MILIEQVTCPRPQGYREIPLTNSSKVALVDASDYAWIIQWEWHLVKRKKVYYAARDRPRVEGLRTKILMHRAIMDFPALEVDHHDGDGLHNWRGNLRLATKSQQQANTALRASNTSGFKGVFAFRGRWRASIKVNYKDIHLGVYDTKEDAAYAYRIAAKNHFGEFANFL